MAKLIVLILCVSIAATQKNGQINQSLEKGNRIGDQELREIHRQNQITQQILSNYLERRLFPFRRPQQRAPSIDEILPTSTERPLRNLRQSQSKRLAFSGKNSRTNNNNNNKRNSYNKNKDDDDDDYDDGVDVDNYDDEASVSDDSDQFDSDFSATNEQYPETLQSVESEHLDSFYDSGVGHVPKDATFVELLRAQKLQSQLQTQLQEIETSVLSQSTALSKSSYSNNVISNYIEDDGINCPNCVDDTPITNRWTMPLLKLGEKRYYLGIFFKANWFRANQYCRFHGMHLASISSQEENDKLEKHIKDFGLGHEHFWTSGTDLADEGSFFWMATGRPITFTNWNAGEPNNFRYENGEEENCLELWNRDGKGLKWNDSPCSFETYFVCEVQ